MSEAWVCAERKANHGANDPPECNWPYCGCDPEADRVISGLVECGWLSPREVQLAEAEAHRRGYEEAINEERNHQRESG